MGILALSVIFVGENCKVKLFFSLEN